MQQSPSLEANRSSANQEIPRILWNPKVHTAFTSARHLSLSSSRSIQSMSPQPTSWISILILSSHLRLGLPRGLFLSGFPTKTLYTLLLSSYKLHSTPPPNLILDLITHIIFGDDYTSLRSSPLTCYLVPLKAKYFPQHPILKSPQHTFLPQCEWPSFTPIQYKNNSGSYLKYIAVTANWQPEWRQRDKEWEAGYSA